MSGVLKDEDQDFTYRRVVWRWTGGLLVGLQKLSLISPPSGHLLDLVHGGKKDFESPLENCVERTPLRADRDSPPVQGFFSRLRQV